MTFFIRGQFPRPKGPHTKVAWRGSGGTLLCGLPQFSGSGGTIIRLGSIPVADWCAKLSEDNPLLPRKFLHASKCSYGSIQVDQYRQKRPFLLLPCHLCGPISAPGPIPCRNSPHFRHGSRFSRHMSRKGSERDLRNTVNCFRGRHRGGSGEACAGSRRAGIPRTSRP